MHICRNYLERRALRILEAARESAKTGKAVRLPDWSEDDWINKMGSGASSESSNTQSGSIESLHSKEYNYSFLDLHSFDSSSIALMILRIIILGFFLICMWRRYQRLFKEVSLHRAQNSLIPIALPASRRALNQVLNQYSIVAPRSNS